MSSLLDPPTTATQTESKTAPPKARPAPRPRGRKRWLLLTLSVAAAVAGYVSPEVRARVMSQVSNWFPGSGDDFDYLITETVKRDVFQVTVTERGTVDSLRNAVLTSKVEGVTTIISIVPEGKEVKAGDLVCELDSSVLKDKETQQQIKVTQAKAARDQAEKEKEIQETLNDSDIAAAKLKLELAIIDRAKFEEGDFPQQQRELETAVEVNNANLTRAKEYLSFLERMVRKGYRMQSDLDAERIAFSKATIDRDVANGKLKVLEEFTQLRSKRELEANVKEFVRQVERAEIKANAAMDQKDADLEAKSLTYDVEMRFLTRLQTQIAACEIRAPQDGQVVYANTRDGRQTEQVLIDIGASVKERQAIINLPDLDAMKVNARIHESRISMVHPGLTASIKIDAAPTETYHGSVDAVSSVPSSLNNFNRDLKEYEATVRLTDDVDRVNRLRPGLTATVEILVSQRDDVLQVPVQSLVSVVDKRYVYVLEPNGPELKEIAIGDTNERTVEILSGVEEGDRVVMNPRSHFSKEIGELETKLAKEKSQRPAETTNPPGAAPKDGAPTAPKAAPNPGNSAEPPRMDPVARFQSMDKDGDGKLSAEELSERMRPRFDDMDADHNGSVDQQEFVTFAAQFRRGGQGGPPQGGN